MKKMKKTACFLLIFAGAAYCIFCADEVRDAAYKAIMRCLTTVIPSLYIMMIMSNLLIKTGTADALGRRIPFGEDIAAVLIFSSAAGYPIGPRMILSRYEDGCLDKRSAEVLSGICFAAGTSFVYGCAASGAAGRVVLMSTTASNLIVAAVYAIFAKKGVRSRKSGGFRFSAEMLCDSVNASGRAMAEICFAVVAFALISQIMSSLGIISAISRALSVIMGIPEASAEIVTASLLDVTVISELRGELTNLPLTAAAVSFGGACVFFQIAAIFRGKLSILPMIAVRAVTAVMSYGICRLLMPIFLRGEVMTAAALRPIAYSASSPIPSIMLVIMTGIVLSSEFRVKS